MTQGPRTDATTIPDEQRSPWAALFTLCLGFFMILVDVTIVSVATPTIITELHASTNAVIWVTSAYALAYAVPLLITGRLGDRFGSKRLYLLGLTIFTLSSLWCGLTNSITVLIVARVAQGLGAAVMTPQTMAIITRIFPAERRGQAMAVWGATSGVALVAGPVLGGVLTEWAGWEWIFFINVPIGVAGFLLAVRNVPSLPTHTHSFDWLGVALSGLGMFGLVFGIQEGHQHDWNGWIIACIGGGIAFIVLFLLWQAKNTKEPLMPLGLFKDRNFSVASIAMSAMGFAFTSMVFPYFLYLEAVRGMSVLQASLTMLPMAIAALVLAKFAGDLIDRFHPRYVIGAGLLVACAGELWITFQMRPGSPLWTILAGMTVLGLGQAFIWAPNAATATRNLPNHLAGAGSGVFNTVRQVGGAIGAAAIAVIIDSRVSALLPGQSAGNSDAGAAQLPEIMQEPFAKAMLQSDLLPGVIVFAGFLAALFFTRPKHLTTQTSAPGGH